MCLFHSLSIYLCSHAVFLNFMGAYIYIGGNLPPSLRGFTHLIARNLHTPSHQPVKFYLKGLLLFQKGLFGLPDSLSVVPAVLFDGFILQFVPAGLDHCVQHNLPLWAEGDVMRLLRRHLEVMVDSKFC